MPFLHPQLAWAALATAVIPLIIHFLNRRRYRTVPWAAMLFLMAASRRTARRMRLEQLTLLALRVAALVLLGLAVARPFVAVSPLVALGRTAIHRILVLDNSGSMAALVGDGSSPTPPGATATRWSRAQCLAGDLLGSFPASDPVSIVAMTAPVEEIGGHALTDRRQLGDHLQRCPHRAKPADVVGALETVADVLEESPTVPGNRAVYLISDLARGSWSVPGEAAAQAAHRITQQSALYVLACAAQETDDNGVANAAVIELGPRGSLVAAGVPVHLTAVVGNFARHDAMDLSLQVRRGDRILRTVPVPVVEPGRRTTVQFSVVFDTPGIHGVQARLINARGDVLDLDDERFLSLEVPETIPVLVVDGRPGRSRLTGAAGYLATALSPDGRDRDGSLIDVRLVSPLELSGEALPEYALVCLCDVPRLDQEMWSRVEAYVRAGGGLLVCAGDAIDRRNYNDFGYADGDGVLPARLTGLVGDVGDRHTFVRFAPVTGSHPVTADFADAPRSGLFLARVFRYLAVEHDPVHTEVLLSYDDGNPALLRRDCGAGQTCLFTTTVNMDWTNLPAKGDYVSLMVNLAAALTPSRDRARNLLVGAEMHEPLSAREFAMPVHVLSPQGDAIETHLDTNGDGFALGSGPLEAPGLYTVRVAEHRRVVAVNPDPRISDVLPIDEPALRDLLGCPFTFVAAPEGMGPLSPSRGARELATLAGCLALVMLVTEGYLAMRFAARR